MRDVRVGHGFDVHRLISGKGLTILGIWIEGPWALEGHSDADVALHSLTDALLGACGEGDIGQHFPPQDLRWKNANSALFFSFALERVRHHQGRVSHLDLTLIGEKPKFSPHRHSFLTSLAQLSGLSQDRLGIKATTTEKLGFLGREEGIAAFSTATVVWD